MSPSLLSPLKVCWSGSKTPCISDIIRNFLILMFTCDVLETFTITCVLLMSNKMLIFYTCINILDNIFYFWKNVTLTIYFNNSVQVLLLLFVTVWFIISRMLAPVFKVHFFLYLSVCKSHNLSLYFKENSLHSQFFHTII